MLFRKYTKKSNFKKYIIQPFFLVFSVTLILSILLRPLTHHTHLLLMHHWLLLTHIKIHWHLLRRHVALKSHLILRSKHLLHRWSHIHSWLHSHKLRHRSSWLLSL